MDINDFFERMMKVINRFADEVIEQQAQEKMQETGRGPEYEGKKTENIQPEEKPSMKDFPKRE